MTPLEEIEQAMQEAKLDRELNDVNRRVLLSNLYQARAIERLEATVRAIGVMWQSYAAETLPLMHKMSDMAAPAPPKESV